MKNIITDLTMLADKQAAVVKFLNENGFKDDEIAKSCDSYICDLKAYLEANPTVKAICAPQLGIDARIVCIRFNDQIKVFIDPIATKKLNHKIVVEECASMPNQEIVITRATELHLEYTNENYEPESNKLLDTSAILMDQQLNLLDGITPDMLGMVSNVDEVGPISDEDLPEIIDYYLNTFIKRKKELYAKYISELSDEDNTEYRKLKFSESVITGKTIIVDSPELTEAKADLNKNLKLQKNKRKNAMNAANYKSYVAMQTRKVSKKKGHR